MAKNKHFTRTMLCILPQGLFDYIVQKIIEGGLRWCPQARLVSLARQVSSSGRGKELESTKVQIYLDAFYTVFIERSAVNKDLL